MRIIPLIAFVSLILILAVMLLNTHEPLSVAREASRAPFPTITVTGLDDEKPWKPEALKKHVTLINFYASWCTPCAEEMPELASLKKKFPKLRIVGIAWNDKPEKLHAWLKTNGNPFDSLWLDTKGDATIDLGIKGIPESFIIDAEGVVRYRLSGALNQDVRAAEIDALIETLLTEAKHAK